MYTILAPLDGSELSERALGVAQTLARALDGTLEVVTVFDDPATLSLMPGLVVPDRLAAERYVESVAARIPAGISVRATILLGAPVDQILALAAEQPETIIVMSTHGRGGLGRIMFGSVADKVLRGAGCPVALVRASEQQEPREPFTVLVPLDGSELAERALPLAMELGRRTNGEVVLVRVAPSFWSAPYVAYAPVPAYLSSDQITELTNESKREASDYLDRVATTLRDKGARVSAEVRSGPAADEIVQLARAVHPDLIVMSSHGRGGFRRWALGSVANEVLYHGTTPVVIVPMHESAGATEEALSASIVLA